MLQSMLGMRKMVGEVQKVSKEAFEYVKIVALDRSLIMGGLGFKTTLPTFSISLRKELQ